MTRPSTLISTLPPDAMGGVSSKARILADHLRRCGHRVTVAHYVPHSAQSDLNAGTPSMRLTEVFDGHEAVEVGCRRPYLEHNLTRSSDLWQDLIRSHDRHVAVGGSVLIANPLAEAGVGHLIWCAGDVMGDRLNRINAASFPRRFLDSAFVRPRLLEQQKVVLRGSGAVLGVSPFSLRSLRTAVPDATVPLSVLPIPTDAEFFSPPSSPPGQASIGFAGRIADPRKNARLLFSAFAQVSERLPDARLAVTGEPDNAIHGLIRAAGISEKVDFHGRLEPQQLREFYRRLDVLVIPSYQEGHAIVGVEAMACGVPVISTRCGGPEAYVHDGETGYLADDAATMADRIHAVVTDAGLHDKLSGGARAIAVDEFAHDAFAAALAEHWRAMWNEDLRRE